MDKIFNNDKIQPLTRVVFLVRMVCNSPKIAS